MIALQILAKMESLYRSLRQAKKFQGFVWNFATLQGSHLDYFFFLAFHVFVSFSFSSNISVKIFRFST